MGLPGMVLSAISFTAGAILYWAVTYQSPYIRLSTVGFILMVVGIIGFVASAALFGVTEYETRSARRAADRRAAEGRQRSEPTPLGSGVTQEQAA
jgi:hypothetical protein